MSHTVIGIFEQSMRAQQARQALMDVGFSNDHIDVNTSGYSDANMDTRTTPMTGETYKSRDDDDSIAGFFRNLFGGDDDDDDERNRYIEAGRRGTIVTVHARSAEEAEQAAALLDKFGAVDVDEYAGRFNTSGATGYGTVTDSTADLTQDTDKIQVIEENTEVGKREIETGGVRLHSRIVERPVEESIRLRTERVAVERTPVDRPATEADFDAFKEGTIEVKEHAEIPVVSKDARVVEEISLGKEIEENEETIRDTVRNTEVRTEEIPGEETKRRDDLDV